MTDQLAIRRANFSEQQDGIVKKLAPKTRNIPCFEYEGEMFKGDGYTAVVDFAYNNPTGGDFYVWLRQNYKMLIPVS